MSVPLFDREKTIAPLLEDLQQKSAEILKSGKYILGENVKSFEDEFANYLGVKHVIGVASGTDAITLALTALGVGSGDEVIVPSFTFYASVEAIFPTGARPIFCDVDRDTFCITVETVKKQLTKNTKAIIAVDLFGNIAPIDELKTLGIPVIEDAAQAAGSSRNGFKAGSFGDLAAFSFFPSKNLGGFGDGGAVATDDDNWAEHVRMLRFHGSKDKSEYKYVGYNSRLDELQAGFLRILLPYLDNWCAGRRRAEQHYLAAGLNDLVTVPTAPPNSQPAWHLYVVRHAEIQTAAKKLTEMGIGNKAYYRTPVHRQEAMKPFINKEQLPVTDELAKSHLAIPMSPILSFEQAHQVVTGLSKALSEVRTKVSG